MKSKSYSRLLIARAIVAALLLVGAGLPSAWGYTPTKKHYSHYWVRVTFLSNPYCLRFASAKVWGITAGGTEEYILTFSPYNGTVGIEGETSLGSGSMSSNQGQNGARSGLENVADDDIDTVRYKKFYLCLYDSSGNEIGRSAVENAENLVVDQAQYPSIDAYNGTSDNAKYARYYLKTEKLPSETLKLSAAPSSYIKDIYPWDPIVYPVQVQMPTVAFVSALQRYPWNTKVDVKYSLSGLSASDSYQLKLIFTVGGVSKTVQQNLPVGVVDGDYTTTVDLATYFDAGVVDSSAKINLELTQL